MSPFTHQVSGLNNGTYQVKIFGYGDEFFCSAEDANDRDQKLITGEARITIRKLKRLLMGRHITYEAAGFRNNEKTNVLRDLQRWANEVQGKPAKNIYGFIKHRKDMLLLICPIRRTRINEIIESMIEYAEQNYPLL